jgi:hypothetical protein
MKVMIKEYQYTKCIMLLAFGIGLMGLAGCATTGMSEGYFYQQNGEYQLVSRNNDLYLEKLDGKEGRRLTNTPENAEFKVRFVADGKYIIYLELARRFPLESHKAYIIPTDGDDSERKEINQEQLENLR